MPGIGVVTNPHSRQNRRNPRLLKQLAYVLGDKGQIDQPSSPEGMEKVAERFLDREIDVLCVNGGDGTGHVVLSAMAQVYGERPLPMVAYLRGGTMNTVSSGLGVRGKPSELLEKVVRKYHEGEPFVLAERSLMCVDQKYYGFMFGNGLISNFLELYYEGSEPSPLKAAALLVRCSLSALVGGRLVKRLMRPVEAEVSLDDEKIPAHKFLGILAGTVDDLGLRFRPFHLAPKNLGSMHAIGLACSPAAVVSQLHHVRLGRATHHPGIHSRLVKRLRIEASRPLSFMVDGDFHGGGQVVEVTMGPSVRFITG